MESNLKFIENLLNKKCNKTIVIKIGSSLLLDKDKKYQIRQDWLISLGDDIKKLKDNGKNIVIVSSGAVGLGRGILGLGSGINLDEKQAAASVGQISLISAWKKILEDKGIITAQILLSYNDTEDGKSRNNIQKTISNLIQNDVIPIINENDSTGVEELKYGDNDRMATRVAKLCGASDLLLLTDTDGLYDTDPSKNDNAEFIKTITNFNDDNYFGFAGGSSTNVGTGGMQTKITAGFMAKLCGINTIIARGNINNPISNLIKTKRATIIHRGVPLQEHDIWDLAFLDYNENENYRTFFNKLKPFSSNLPNVFVPYEIENPYMGETTISYNDNNVNKHFIIDGDGNKFLCKYKFINEETEMYAAYDLKNY